ncbi:MAG: hypothetical protein JSU94_02080 [Phycisphaerales bacterium]|nr:MAG: hypothetical protein JSU94_02080 [Phycisphaerales bacterium]
MRLKILGIGWVTPWGIGSGQSGEVFQPGPGKLPAMRSRHFLDKPHNRFGRFDQYTKAGFGAIALALRSAGLNRWKKKQPIGLVLGTRRGSLETDAAYFETAAYHGGAMASPNLFAYTLPNCVLGEASIQFGLTGPAFVVDDTGSGHLDGIHTALNLIRWGLCQTVVAGWCDVDSKMIDVNSGGQCGAIFFVLTEGSDTALWRWQGGRIFFKSDPIDDIGEFARFFLETKTGG